MIDLLYYLLIGLVISVVIRTVRGKAPLYIHVVNFLAWPLPVILLSSSTFLNLIDKLGSFLTKEF